jgi:diaminohydroxyphosphoribosylaminopyrimidine deaminase/5-amino-6-(5-phosphoribosylamino)uracil reductase
LQGAGRVGENPLVGAVLVDCQQRFIALGWHDYFGGPHAEAALMTQIKSGGREMMLADATLYCTLEPCSYVGKTGACTALLEDLPISRIVIAERDPNPRVNGRGIALLQQAGKEVIISPEFAQITGDLLAPFRCLQELSRPFVAAKIAASLDGMIGSAGARRQWLTNERARRYGHWLRQLYDGVVVGADTVIADNPALDPYLYPAKNKRSPWKIVLDPQGRALQALPLAEQRLLQHNPQRVLWVLSPASVAALPRDLVVAAEQLQLTIVANTYMAGKGFALDELLAYVRSKGIASLLLEGGRQVWGSFANQGLLDKVFLFQAPSIIGSASGMHWSGAFHVPESMILDEPKLTTLDDNWLITAYVQRKYK